MFQDKRWTSLELKRTMTRLNLLYEISLGQIDIDVIPVYNPILKLELRGVIVIDIGKIM